MKLQSKFDLIIYISTLFLLIITLIFSIIFSYLSQNDCTHTYQVNNNGYVYLIATIIINFALILHYLFIISTTISTMPINDKYDKYFDKDSRCVCILIIIVIYNVIYFSLWLEGFFILLTQSNENYASQYPIAAIIVWIFSNLILMGNIYISYLFLSTN